MKVIDYMEFECSGNCSVMEIFFVNNNNVIVDLLFVEFVEGKG